MELTGKYAKLRDDLIAALAAGRSAEEKTPNDGGTCNFDSPTIDLPRWQSEKIKQAAQAAGTHCYKWFGSTWVFSPRTRAQGYARTRNAEAAKNKLCELGYQAYMYYAMD